MTNGDKLTQTELKIIKDKLKKFRKENEFEFNEEKLIKKLSIIIINQPVKASFYFVCILPTKHMELNTKHKMI